MAESTWWLGLYADHLYETCPGRLRTLPELQRTGWDKQGRGTVDPLGTDICGWCRRVWVARNQTRGEVAYWRDRTTIRPESGCWLWKLGIDKDGYGQIGNGKSAHRVAYESLVGPIPAGLTIDHTCHNDDLACDGSHPCMHRRCVNPRHLEPTTQRVNTHRGRAPSALNRMKTRCPAGHPYSGDNLYVDPAGHRHCRTCGRDRSARYQRYRRSR